MIPEETMKKINKIVDSYTFYPNMKRKNREERIQDNIAWYNERGSINLHYNAFGLDIENFRDSDDYLEFYFIRNKTHHGGIKPSLHRILADDKFFFYSYFESIFPGYTPKIHLLLDSKKVYFPIAKYSSTEKALLNLEDKKYACKQSTGAMGVDFFLLEKKEDKYFSNGEEISIADVLEKINNRRYIIQDFIVQNSEFGKIAPNSLNTIRMETLRYHEETHIFYAVVRFSTKSDAVVDNASQGGTFVGIDVERGVLRKYGEYFKNEAGVHETKHPRSGIVYNDFKIPMWDEIIKLVKNLHPLFYGVPSIGWDIALTESGPIIIEMNYQPDPRFAQMANGGLRKRFYELKRK